GRPSASPAPPEALAGDSAAQNSPSAESTARDMTAGGLDRTVADACARTLAGGPAAGSTLVAVGTGTYEDTPAVVAVFNGENGTTAFVASRDGCRLLTSFPV
ncbi:MAG: hypothetical protein ACRDZ7_15090, partial [Acidimicrobiia bacterium]